MDLRHLVDPDYQVFQEYRHLLEVLVAQVDLWVLDYHSVQHLRVARKCLVILKVQLVPVAQLVLVDQ